MWMRIKMCNLENANELIKNISNNAASYKNPYKNMQNISEVVKGQNIHPCLSNGSSTSTRSADIRAVLISNGKPRLRPPGFFNTNWPPRFPLLVPAAILPASRFRVIFGRARPPPEMSHPTVRRIVELPPVNTDDIPTMRNYRRSIVLEFYELLIIARNQYLDTSKSIQVMDGLSCVIHEKLLRDYRYHFNDKIKFIIR